MAQVACWPLSRFDQPDQSAPDDQGFKDVQHVPVDSWVFVPCQAAVLHPVLAVWADVEELAGFPPVNEIAPGEIQRFGNG